MRIVVAADAVAGLSPAAASAHIAAEFAAVGGQVAVVPLGVAGEALSEALAAAAPDLAVARPVSPAEVGQALHEADGPLLLDLTGTTADALGAAALEPFGDDPREALAEAQRRWAGRELIALVPGDQDEIPLYGLSGWAATQGRAGGADLSGVLARDAEAERWVETLGVEALPGSGAVGGLGLIVQALGGSVVSPLTFLTERFGLERTMAAADLVVTGAQELDFHAVGGPVVKRVVAMAEEALRPVVAVVGRNFVSSRELRLAGLEDAYAMLAPGEPGDPTPEALSAVSRRVAQTWSW